MRTRVGSHLIQVYPQMRRIKQSAVHVNKKSYDKWADRKGTSQINLYAYVLSLFKLNYLKICLAVGIQLLKWDEFFSVVRIYNTCCEKISNISEGMP